LAALFLFLAPLEAAQCLGITREGVRCKRQVTNGSYCYQHNPAVKHCAGQTKEGSPCRNLPESGSDYCRLHKSAPTEKPALSSKPRSRPATSSERHTEFVTTVQRCEQQLAAYNNASFGERPFNAERYEQIRHERDVAQGELNAGN
jgi:hypothetical protein